MWRLKENALGKSKLDNAKEIKRQLEALKSEIKGIIKLEVGINILESDQSYDVVLNSEFIDQDSLDSYQIHPKHVEVSNYITDLREERVVVDYETA